MPHFLPSPPQPPKNQVELTKSPSLGPKMTKENFKAWLKSIDTDGDGHVSRQELRVALKSLGMNHTWWKSWRAMVRVDLDHNKLIEGDKEVDELIKYAEKHWGFVFSKDFIHV